MAGALVGKLKLGADHAPVVAADQVDVVTHLAVDIDREAAVEEVARKVGAEIVGEPQAPFHANITALVAFRRGRSGQGDGRERGAN